MKLIPAILAAALTLAACSGDKQSSGADGSVSPVPVKETAISTEGFDKALSGLKNMKPAEDMIVSAPETARLREFEYASVKPPEGGKMLEDYRTLFDCCFPGKEPDESKLEYEGAHSHLVYNDEGEIRERYKTVSEMRESIISGSEEVNMIFYDEPADRGHTGAFLLAQASIGCGLLNLNRGVLCSEYLKQTGSDDSMRLETVDVSRLLQKTAAGESVRLLDKEVKITAAAKAFEEDINSLPIYSGKPFRITVTGTEVFQSAGLSCILFSTARSYDGIPFDSTDCPPEGYCPEISEGYMVRSNQTDRFYGIGLDADITNENGLESVISLQEAAERISGELTDQVVFEVKRAELCYCVKEAPSADWGKDIHQTSPAWKLTLFNPNDNFNYFCYVDAADGGNFRYSAKEENK